MYFIFYKIRCGSIAMEPIINLQKLYKKVFKIVKCQVIDKCWIDYKEIKFN